LLRWPLILKSDALCGLFNLIYRKDKRYNIKHSKSRISTSWFLFHWWNCETEPMGNTSTSLALDRRSFNTISRKQWRIVGNSSLYPSHIFHNWFIIAKRLNKWLDFEHFFTRSYRIRKNLTSWYNFLTKYNSRPRYQWRYHILIVIAKSPSKYKQGSIFSTKSDIQGI